jgi:short-subunit dehydrogenase
MVHLETYTHASHTNSHTHTHTRTHTNTRVCSVQGKFGIPYRAGYSASKHALSGYCDALRAEVAADGVRVLSVYPGYIRTNLSMNALTSALLALD